MLSRRNARNHRPFRVCAQVRAPHFTRLFCQPAKTCDNNVRIGWGYSSELSGSPERRRRIALVPWLKIAVKASATPAERTAAKFQGRLSDLGDQLEAFRSQQPRARVRLFAGALARYAHRKTISVS